MSIQKRGSRYVVRWREGGRQLQRTFIKHGDASAFETDVKRRQQLGALAPGVIQSRMTLAAFVREEWWPRYAVPNLKASTMRRYLEVGAPICCRHSATTRSEQSRRCSSRICVRSSTNSGSASRRSGRR